MDHRHIFLFDPFEIEGEEIGAETVGHAIGKPRRGIAFIGAKDPAAALFTHIPFRIGIAQHGMFGPAVLAIGHKRRIRFGHDELMFHRNGRDLDPQQFRSALRMVSGRRHHMFCRDDDLFVRGDKVAAFFHHLGAGDLPSVAGPVIAIDLPFAFNAHAALTGTLGHRHGHVGGVNIAIRRVINRALQVFGPHQGPAILDLGGRHPFIGHLGGFRG